MRSKQEALNRKNYYEDRALAYAERYGIITYRVKGNTMIFNQNYRNSEVINGKWMSKPCTYQEVVNLDTMKSTRRKLGRLQKDGWDNV